MNARRPSDRRRWPRPGLAKELPLQLSEAGEVAGGVVATAAAEVTQWHAEWAWLGGGGGRWGNSTATVHPDVLIEVDGNTITAVAAGVSPAPPTATRLAGLTIPGLANAHSHAFHRALRGRTQASAGDFWAWRKQMYVLAERLDPDTYHWLARACFAEMALAGITTVGEFHYLHHGAGGIPYDDPNAMAEALRAAAEAAGIRLTLLDTLYLHGGFGGEELDPVQQRFSDGDVEHWAARVAALADSWTGDPTARVGVAIHSVRAVDPASAKAVAGVAAERGEPLHVHVSEQLAENRGCWWEHERTPTGVLADAGVLGPGTTVVHATHLAGDDYELLERSGSTVCLCPTTERDLADGVGPARTMVGSGIPLALGSDSHAVVDLFEEARAVELDERLVSGRRGGLSPAVLLDAATRNGARCLGWPSAGSIAPGQLADLVTVSTSSVHLAGALPDDLVAAAVFSATAADVTDVVVGGRPVVRDRQHVLVDDVPGALAAAMEPFGTARKLEAPSR